MKILKKILMISALCFIAFFIYDHLLLNNIDPKKHKDNIRIGTINLHEHNISADDLKRLRTYQCDIWLFLEWNGTNLDNDAAFTSDYIKNFELSHAGTFGVSVFSTFADLTVEEIGAENRPYACDYPKFIIHGKDFELFLLHAPPPVPSCKFETGKYITDFLPYIKHSKKNAQIIIGDLNSVPFQESIGAIKKMGFTDSHDEISNLPQGTFAPFTWCPKFLKFDYLFHNQYVQAAAVERFSISTSDHSGWIADYQIKNH